MNLSADIKVNWNVSFSPSSYRYDDGDLERIAEALSIKDIDAAKIAAHQQDLDEASREFASMTGYRDLIPDKKVSIQLKTLARAADRLGRQAYTVCIARGCEIDKSKFGDIQPLSRPSPKRYHQAKETLLDSLGVTWETAADGIPNDHVRAHLQSLRADVADEHEREQELQRLLDVITDECSRPPDVLNAARELSHRAVQGIKTVQELRQMMIRPGHSGDAAINLWIDEMLNLYVALTGRDVGTSTVGPLTSGAGEPSGPLIRFLKAAGGPLEISFSDAGWKSRIKTARKIYAQNKI